jgi:predicted ATP-dependent serine protease
VAWTCLLCGAQYTEHRTACGSCWERGVIIDVGQRPRAETDGIVEAMSAVQIARLTWQEVRSRRYARMTFGRGCLAVLVGPPAAGKSSLLAGLIDGIDGPVLLLSVEEPIGPTLAARLLRVGVKREDFRVVSRATVDQLVAILNDVRAVAFGIDSFQPSLPTPRDLRHLLAVVPTLHLIAATSQVNRDGEISGSRELEHEADVVLHVDAFEWRLDKSRYQETQPEVSGEVRVRDVPAVVATSTPSTAHPGGERG